MSLTHLLDTSVYSQPIKREPLLSVMQRWGALGDQSLCSSIICEAEVIQGLEIKNSPKLRQAYEAILKNRLPIFPVDLGVARIYARLQAAFVKNGRVKPVFDLLIAATALAHKLILVTCNFRDFEDIEGLIVEDWSVF